MSQQLTTQQSSLLAVSENAKSLMPTLIKLAKNYMPAGSTDDDAERIVTRELSNLESVLNMKPELAVCTTLSKIQALKDCIGHNLSLSPSSNLTFLYPSQITVGMDGANAPVKEWVVVYEPTSNGALSIARQAGRIFDYDANVTYNDSGNVYSVSVTYLLPTVGGTRWSKPYIYMLPHFNKWRNAASKKYGGKVPANYTSWNQDEKFQNGTIDPDFAITKAIKHSLKRLGTNMNEAKGIVPTVVLNQLPIIVPISDSINHPIEKQVMEKQDMSERYPTANESDLKPAPDFNPEQM